MSAKGIDRAEIDRIAARINGMYRNRPEPRPSVTRGTVQAVGEYTYDVAMPDGAVLLGVKRTVGAGGASVGDECLIEWIAGSAYVTGVVATSDSSHYVKYSTGGNGGVEITPERDCDIFVIAARSNAWGYAGGDVTLSIDSRQLKALSKHIGAISNGDTVGRELIAWAVFTGAKKGTNYQFSEAYTGQVQGNGNRTMLAVCL